MHHNYNDSLQMLNTLKSARMRLLRLSNRKQAANPAVEKMYAVRDLAGVITDIDYAISVAETR